MQPFKEKQVDLYDRHAAYSQKTRTGSEDKTGTNYATFFVLDYKSGDPVPVVITKTSLGGDPKNHAEQRAWSYLKQQYSTRPKDYTGINLPLDDSFTYEALQEVGLVIQWVFSERQPCPGCILVLKKILHPDTPVYWYKDLYYEEGLEEEAKKKLKEYYVDSLYKELTDDKSSKDSEWKKAIKDNEKVFNDIIPLV